MRSVELFSGAGGLAMGLARAGFKHDLMVEWDHDACVTLGENKRRGVRHVRDWPFVNEDARAIDYSALARRDCWLAGGGPPCQPFSVGGKHRGADDDRDMWPEAIRAVRELAPRAFLFENVRGLMREAFADYLRWIELHLAFPELTRRRGEHRGDHLSRLERAFARPNSHALRYHVMVQPVNAADYGAPQTRRRVIIVGFRDDLDVEWAFPDPTHSREALLRDKWITGEYWERHRIARARRPSLPARDRKAVDLLRSNPLPRGAMAWVTTRDAIGDLPPPARSGTPAVPNHVFQPGARSYAGHTGSSLDEPAKALKAGDHGVPGGENMLASPDGSVRYFTVREAARLQGFPDNFVFPVSWTESMRQIGNAVPSMLAEVVATSVANALREAERIARRARRVA